MFNNQIKVVFSIIPIKILFLLSQSHNYHYIFRYVYRYDISHVMIMELNFQTGVFISKWMDKNADPIRQEIKLSK